jgi:hypothetical protein
MNTLEILILAYREQTQDATAAEPGTSEHHVLQGIATWIDGVADEKADLLTDLKFWENVLGVAGNIARSTTWTR